MLAVTKWLISTFYGFYASRWANSGNEKKPFNPVLGEQFFAVWKDGGVGEGGESGGIGDFNMYCEQGMYCIRIICAFFYWRVLYSPLSPVFIVSHHPPVTAFYFRNEKAGVYLNGHCGQKTRFAITAAAIKVEQTGNIALYIEKYGEEYVISYPELHLRGLVTGNMFVDLNGTVSIACSSSGLEAKIEFLQKPWIGGEYHVIKGAITNSNSKDVLFALSGKWNEKVFYSPAGSNQPILLFDPSSSAIVMPYIAPVEEQGELESRKLWFSVKSALDAGEWNKVNWG